MSRRKTTLYLVVQQGGSSGEYYPSLYNQEQDALDAKKGHEDASYNAWGPFAVPALRESGSGSVTFSEQTLIDIVTEVLRESE